MKNLTLRNLERVCHGTYHGSADALDLEVSSITTDSRQAQPGCLFIPIVGERVDAHRFIDQVMEAGALATLSQRDLPGASFPYIQVSSSLQAVKDIARFYLEGLTLPVVGVTGSVGKTSTKEMIASVLAQKYRTLKTLGNFNNELGLPLTVFRLRQEDEMAVLEMGISDFGEMSRLAEIARPHTAVITNIGTCHLENLGDRDGVLRAKTEMLDFVRPDGHIILNGDDDKLCLVGEKKGIRPLFFGIGKKEGQEGRIVYAHDLEDLGLEGMRAVLHVNGEERLVSIPMPGRHMVLNALAAAAVGHVYGLSMDQIQAGIEAVRPLDGRFKRIPTSRCLVVDDCYNANPMSMKAAIDILRQGKGRKIAILGDMGELGAGEEDLHREVGSHVGASGIDQALFVGNLSRYMLEAAREVPGHPALHYYADVSSLLGDLADLVQEGDTVLVKASHFMRFDQIVAKLTEI